MTPTVLILAVCRTPVTLLPMRSRSSVEGAPARCLGGHGFDSCRGLMFFCPKLVSLWSVHFSHSINDYVFLFPTTPGRHSRQRGEYKELQNNDKNIRTQTQLFVSSRSFNTKLYTYLDCESIYLSSGTVRKINSSGTFALSFFSSFRVVIIA